MSDKEFEKENLEEDQLSKEIDKFYNFVMVDEGRIAHIDRVKFELGGYLRQKLDLNDNPITASLSYLYAHHPEMFRTKREIYNFIKDTLESIPEIVEKKENGDYYVAKSLRYAESIRKARMFDLVLEPREDENYIKHGTKRRYSQAMKEIMSADGRNAQSPTYRLAASALSQDQSLDSGSSSNRSPADIENIIPQIPQENNKNLENFNPNDSSALNEIKAEEQALQKQEELKSNDKQNNNEPKKRQLK